MVSFHLNSKTAVFFSSAPQISSCYGISVGCENKAGDDKCYADASVGECKDNPDFMNENCAMACGKCKCTVGFLKMSVRFKLPSSPTVFTSNRSTHSSEWPSSSKKKFHDICFLKSLLLYYAKTCCSTVSMIEQSHSFNMLQILYTWNLSL